MQKDSYKEFDRQLRSMLQDAEEKVPSRVWKGIESRLDAPAPKRFGWVWAVAGLAAAAALATALLFTGTTGNSNQLYIPKEPVAIVENHEATDTPLPEALALAEPQSITAPAQKTISTKRVRGIKAETQVPQEEVTVSTPEEIQIIDQPKPAEKESVAQQTIAELSQTETLEQQDVWAKMLAEDEARSRERKNTLAFTANSSLGSNISGIGVMTQRPAAMHAARMAAETPKAGITENSASTYGIPVSFGVGVRFPLANKLSLGTGLEYTYLSRKFTGTYTQVVGGAPVFNKGDIRHGLHYIGIPLNLYFSFIDTKRLNLYAFGGGTAEYCLSSKYNISSSVPDMVYREKVKGLQFSTQLGIGIQCKLTNNLGIYFDPSAQYYFKSNQPKSIRTDKQFMVGAQLGLRFNL